MRLQLWQADREWGEAVQAWNAAPFSSFPQASLEERVAHFHRLTLTLQSDLPPNKARHQDTIILTYLSCYT